MAATFVQKGGGRNFAGGSTVDASFGTGNTTAGNSIVGFVHWISTTITLTSVTSSVAGALTLVDNPTGGSGSRCAMFYLHNITGGGTDNIVAQLSGTCEASIAFHEVSGLQNVAPENHQINNDNFIGTGTDVITSGADVTTTTAGQYIFGATAAQFTTLADAGTGFTLRHNNPHYVCTEDQVQVAAGAIKVKFTPLDNDGYLTGIMTFKAASGGDVSTALSGSASTGGSGTQSPGISIGL